MRRPGTTYGEALQAGKERNVERAAELINGLVVASGSMFSYHHAVGPPTRRNGFTQGAELQDGALGQGVGGGSCQVSNLLYVLALLSGSKVTERHRHALDLFPDSGRAVPFGCGATIFFPMKDLRFRNQLQQDMLLRVFVEDGYLIGEIRTRDQEEFACRIVELSTNMSKDGAYWYRENRVGRVTLHSDGTETIEEVARNFARCAYDPTGSQPTEPFA